MYLLATVASVTQDNWFVNNKKNYCVVDNDNRHDGVGVKCETGEVHIDHMGGNGNNNIEEEAVTADTDKKKQQSMWYHKC